MPLGAGAGMALAAGGDQRPVRDLCLLQVGHWLHFLHVPFLNPPDHFYPAHEHHAKLRPVDARRL